MNEEELNRVEGGAELQQEIGEKILDMLPGLIGGIDAAIKDHVGAPLPFVVVVFGANSGFHATNYPNAADANRMLAAYVAATQEKENVQSVKIERPREN